MRLEFANFRRETKIAIDYYQQEIFTLAKQLKTNFDPFKLLVGELSRAQSESLSFENRKGGRYDEKIQAFLDKLDKDEVCASTDTNLDSGRLVEARW